MSARSFVGWALGAVVCLNAAVVALAQNPADKPAAATKKPPYRQIVPGIEKTIPADLRASETSSDHQVIELLASGKSIDWKPKLYPETQTLKFLATNATFRRSIYCFEFTFKAPRMIWVDVPQPTGKFQRKLIWYVLYHVKNPGGQLKPTEQKDGTWTVEQVNEPERFEPQFVIESLEYKKAYLDRIIPVAVEAIRKKEDPNRRLLNSVEIGAKLIPVSTERADASAWGVATWEDVDPRIDFFSIYIQGLSNAYKWTDPPGAYKKNDPPGTGRVMTYKTLMLNFWRPGDEFAEDEREIRFGIPGKVDYEWVYR